MQLDNPLTEADCAYCLKIITQDSPQTQAEIARLERLNLPVPQLAEQDAAQRAQAELIIREFWPNRLPLNVSPVGNP
jgi:hypothetical protein